MDGQENMIEFTTGQNTATVTFTNRKYINRIRKLYEKPRDDFTYFVENKDGSVCAKIPLKWIRIKPGRKNSHVMTDEQKESARNRLKKYHESKKK